MAVSVAVAWWVAGWPLALVLASYVAVSGAYSLWLKHMAVIELAALSAGFVLRAVGGGVASHVPLSNWFLVVICFGALFVIAGKRAAEHRHLGDGRGDHRPALDGYTATFLGSALTLTAAVTVTAYCLWAFDRSGLVLRAGPRAPLIELTVAPVVIGVLYVLQRLDAGEGGTPEHLLFRDRVLQVLGVAWVGLFAVGIYG
jgi:decaprenyl-phosphate phosphoribosyltransferase